PYGFFEAGPEAGKSIFETLGDLDHHLLLFEGLEPDPRLEAAREEIEGLLDRYELSVNVQRIESANQKLHERYGANASSMLLIRPDGHVAFRSAVADVVGLKIYLDRLFTRRGVRERALSIAHQDQTAR
ncbi:MAG TPA: hypothetical protein VFJ72_11925, partial [Rubrobacteraceae bacterium]|nr:hypothetical protein [Rubrobacteraceae bacterium]